MPGDRYVRGREEVQDLGPLSGRARVRDEVVLLLHAPTGRALYLSPFLFWSVTRESPDARLLWLESLVPQGSGESRSRYRHPVLSHEVARHLHDPEAPEGAGATVRDYIERRDRWPARADLELDAPSLAKLKDPSEPLTLEEHYRVVGKLGEGGMGVVWEVLDTRLRRRCAFKQLNPALYRSPEILKRFDREGQILADLDHKRIVRVYQSGNDSSGAPYLVMELVEGDSLEQILGKRGPLPSPEAVALAAETLEALEVCHSRGVIHRDVKPSNLIRGSSGLKLIDFGIATAQGRTRITRTNDRMGTEEFMAPEQSRGEEATPASDVYAVGKLLFTLVAGRCPFSAEETLREAVPTAPSSLEAICSVPPPGERSPRHRAASADRC